MDIFNDSLNKKYRTVALSIGNSLLGHVTSRMLPFLPLLIEKLDQFNVTTTETIFLLVKDTPYNSCQIQK